MSVTVGTDFDRALDAGVERLLSLQKPGGWWVAELESNVTMTAQHIFWTTFLGRADEDTVRGCANELLARQNADGTWSIYWGGEPDLAATVEAYAALRMAGLGADDPRLAGARRYVEGQGGIGATRVFTRIWPVAATLTVMKVKVPRATLNAVEFALPFGSYTNSSRTMRVLAARLNAVPSVNTMPTALSAAV